MKVRILKVSGHSMHPTLESGAFVLVLQLSATPLSTALLPNIGSTLLSWNWFKKLHSKINYVSHLQVGDIIAVNHAHYGKIIKRISQIKYTDTDETSNKKFKTQHIHSIRLKSDNQVAGISEEQIGWVSVDDILGKVIISIPKH